MVFENLRKKRQIVKATSKNQQVMKQEKKWKEYEEGKKGNIMMKCREIQKKESKANIRLFYWEVKKKKMDTKGEFNT